MGAGQKLFKRLFNSTCVIQQLVSSFFGGVAFSLVISPPVEWSVHRWMLHPKSTNVLNRDSHRGHTKIHHEAYKGPAHYYQDATNKHAVIHFAKADIGKIAGIASMVGLAVDRGYAALSQQSDFKAENGAFIAGTVAGAMVAYGAGRR